jgi:peroxiredoxin
MYPHERSLVARMKDKPFTILGINSDPAERYKKAIKENNITWPSFWDGGKTGGPIATEWAVRAWPTIYILDAKGVIRYKNARGDAMDVAVDALMKEMEGE